ncbi:hypothetical protein GWI33_000530 [Rhynchophorus ferrugineus]|uniref:Uncharacterized protein n=1 Tax=Rhynchophorus ferrugineus TaxID=354439 RepID=A0A834IMS5_RHYFE|nr:hypothetical protein GWI33_000530 [Rhynchophorus ferrugineus]
MTIISLQLCFNKLAYFCRCTVRLRSLSIFAAQKYYYHCYRMQSPEVWAFKEPPSSFQIQEYKSLPENVLSEFYFNHLVSVVIPECLRIPQELVKSLTDDCEYYKLSNINLSILVNPIFLDNFVRQGSFTALSIGTRIDCDNCVAVTPTGLLILVLNKATYQSFGLEGSVSFYTQRNKDRYNNAKIQRCSYFEKSCIEKHWIFGC